MITLITFIILITGSIGDVMNARESKRSEKLSDSLVISPSGALAVSGTDIGSSVVNSPSGALAVDVAIKRVATRGNKRVIPSTVATGMVNLRVNDEVLSRAAFNMSAAKGAVIIQSRQGNTAEYSVAISNDQTFVFCVPASRQDELNGRIMALIVEYSEVLKTKARLSWESITASLTEPAPLPAKHEAILNKIFAASEWYDALSICKGAGFSDSNPSAQPNRWKRDGKVFALRRGKTDVYPAYAFGDDFRPLPAMKDVLCVFKDKKSDLKIAAWFASVNSWLRDKRPLDVIGTNPEAVIKAAKVEVAPIDHG